MVGHVVDEQLARLAILGALDQVADAGLAGIARRQRGGIGQHGLDHLERNDFQAFGGAHWLLGEQAEVLQHGEDVDVMLAEAHPETDVRHVEVLGERVHLIMTGQVEALFAHDRQVVGAFDLEHAIGRPLAVLPAVNLTGEFAEIDFRVEIGGEILAVGTGVDVEDVDRLDLVEVFLLRQGGIGVDHARVEAGTEDGGDALFLAFGQVFPLVVAIPRWRFADLARLFMDRGIEIRGAGVDAGAQHGHVEEGRTDIDDDLRFGFTNQRLGRFHVHGVQRIGLDFAGLLQPALGLHAVDDGLAFGDVARRDSNTTEFVVVLRALMGHHLGDTSCTNDKNVFLQLFHPLVLRPQERLDR